jgi:hypothetical protein
MPETTGRVADLIGHAPDGDRERRRAGALSHGCLGYNGARFPTAPPNQPVRMASERAGEGRLRLVTVI